MFFQIYGETAGWQLLGWLLVFAGLVIMNEIARRSKWGGIACFLVLPAVLSVYFIAIYIGAASGAKWALNNDTYVHMNSWFHYAKLYAATAGCIGFMILKYHWGKLGKAHWFKAFPFVIVAINILIAVTSDFESAIRAGSLAGGWWMSSEGVWLYGGWWNVLNGIPKKGLLLAAVKMTALMILITLMNSAGGKASDLFGELTGIAVLLTMLPYFYSCVDLIRFEGVNIRNFVSLICSVLGCVFCFIALMGASSFELAGTFIVSLIILMFYARKMHERQSHSMDNHTASNAH